MRVCSNRGSQSIPYTPPRPRTGVVQPVNSALHPFTRIPTSSPRLTPTAVPGSLVALFSSVAPGSSAASYSSATPGYSAALGSSAVPACAAMVSKQSPFRGKEVVHSRRVRIMGLKTPAVAASRDASLISDLSSVLFLLQPGRVPSSGPLSILPDFDFWARLYGREPFLDTPFQDGNGEGLEVTVSLVSYADIEVNEGLSFRAVCSRFGEIIPFKSVF